MGVGFDPRRVASPVVEQEPVAIRRDHKQPVDQLGVLEDCCMPAPTPCLLSFASSIASGTFGLQ